MAVGRTMAPLPGVLLSLGFFCLPSISAQPGPDIPWGQPVTLVCRGPAGTNTFRLEKQYNKYNCEDPTHEQCKYTDLICEKQMVVECVGCYCVNSSCVSCNSEDNVSRCDPGKTEARFLIPAVNENSVGFYHCLYHIEDLWPNRTDPLELVVRTEDVSDWMPGTPLLPSPSDTPQGPSLELMYIIRTAALAFLLLILLLLLLLYQPWKHEIPRGKGEEGRRQESSILAGGLPEKAPDLATLDDPLMLGRDRASPEAAQEVTYTQLDHRILTHRPLGTAPSRTADPTAQDCTYATLATP